VVRPCQVVSNISLVVFLALLLGLNVGKLLGMFGSGALLAIIVLTLVGAGAGYVLGGPERDARHVLALGTSQRNIAACLIIANANFAHRPQVLVFLAAASLIGTLMMMPVAVRWARHPAVKGACI
jgi:BASS family bile acid:Na+ symporter